VAYYLSMTLTTGRPSPRDRTREDLYELIRSGMAVTRSELAESTGMSRSTVNHAVGRLLAENRVTESDVEVKGPGSGSGRPAARLAVIATGSPVAAIDFGHNHVHVAVATSLGEPLDEEHVVLDVDLNAPEAMACATDLLADLRRRHGIDDLAALVAGIPGPVDARSGLVRSPSILSSWVGRAPGQELEEALGVPVHIENDAVLGAIGEQYRGAGRHHQDFLYVKASHGIGASMVLDGKLYPGANGLAGEIGHTPLSGHSELCRCGNRGCLESVVSVEALRQQYVHTHPNAGADTFDPNDIADTITLRIFEEAGRMLGGVLATFCNLLNPSALVIGGELGSTSSAFLDGVEAAVRRHAQPATAAVIEILPAELGIRAELVGGLQLAASRARR